MNLSKPVIGLGPIHLGIIGLLVVGGVGFYAYKKRAGHGLPSQAIPVYNNMLPYGRSSSPEYDRLGGFDVRDYDGESPVYRMRTKQPNGIINTTTWWENSNSAMVMDLPDRASQTPLSGYIQTSPMP